MFILLDKTPKTENTTESSYKIIICNIEKDESIGETNFIKHCWHYNIGNLRWNHVCITGKKACWLCS